jgi:hypothetical protein
MKDEEVKALLDMLDPNFLNAPAIRPKPTEDGELDIRKGGIVVQPVVSQASHRS